jgi:hypothetical protein
MWYSVNIQSRQTALSTCPYRNAQVTKQYTLTQSEANFKDIGKSFLLWVWSENDFLGIASSILFHHLCICSLFNDAFRTRKASCLAYSSNLKMEVIHSFETSANFNR